MNKGYQMLKVKDICQKASSNLTLKDLDGHDGKYPIFGASGFVKNVDFYHRDTEYLGLVKDGSGVGRIMFLPPQSSVIGTLQYILPKNGFDIRYVGYCLQSIRLDTFRQGAAIPHIYFKDYGETDVFVSLDEEEQQRIVEKLDNAFAKIDEIKANAEMNLKESLNLYKSILEDLTKPHDSWSNNTLGDVVDFVRGPFGGSLTKNMFVESGFAVYEQQHAIHEHLLFRYFVDEKKYKEMERFQVHSGDLIMSCSGVTLGRVVIIPQNAPNGIINQALLKMSIRKGLINEYLCYLIKSPSFQKTIFEHTNGAAIPNLAPVAIIKRIRVHLPSLEEQRLIVNKLDRINESIQRLKKTIEIIHSECSALKQSFLRRAFNGGL